MKTSIITKKRLMLALTLCILFGMLISIAACNVENNEDDPYADLPPLYPTTPEEPDEFIPVESVYIELENIIVERGSLIIPKVTIYPANATNQAYTLHTYDDSVLNMTNGGFIAIAGGYAEIIVTTADGVTNWTSLTVIVSVQRVTLDIREVTLGIGETVRLTSSIFPADATYHSSRFTSSNPSVATVTHFGTIQTLSAGSTEITFSVDDVSASVMVYVEIPVTSISLELDRTTFTIGDEGTFSVEFTPEDATNLAFDVSIGEGAELIDDYTFKVTEAGEIVITVTSHNGFSDSETIIAIDLELLATEVFELTNVRRVDADLPAFVLMRQLRRAAETRSDEIIEYFSHTRPNGRLWSTVLSQFNITYEIAGENIAVGQATAREVVTAWMNSPSHRENILRNDYRQIGIGVSMDNEGALYWVQLFMD